MPHHTRKAKSTQKRRPTAAPAEAALLTKAQVAALLQSSERSLERHADAIPGRVRLPGGSVRFRRTVVETWIAQGCPPLDDFKHA
jgi:hypothetical protein